MNLRSTLAMVLARLASKLKDIPQAPVIEQEYGQPVIIKAHTPRDLNDVWRTKHRRHNKTGKGRGK